MENETKEIRILELNFGEIMLSSIFTRMQILFIVAMIMVMETLKVKTKETKVVGKKVIIIIIFQ